MTKLGVSVLIVLLAALVGGGLLALNYKTPQSPVITPGPGEVPAPTLLGDCYVGGCSGQICSDQKDIVSTCEYKEEYACYKSATCERQASGKCGWTDTPALRACIISANSASGYVAGHVTIGPICPVERVDQPCKPSPETYTSREVIVYGSDAATVKTRTHLDGEGNYRIALSPGKYFLQISPAGIREGEKKPVTITSGTTTIVDFDIDTGIR